MTHNFNHILAFDCSGGACSAALWRDGGIVAEHFAIMDRGQAERLLPMIEEIAQGGFSALDILATTVGPGSFTGIRLGLAAARGLAIATGLPIVALTSFEAAWAGIAPEERAGSHVAVLIDSRRGPVFGQCFDADGLAGEAFTCETGELARHLPQSPLIFAGDGVKLLNPGQLPPEARIAADSVYIRAASVARLAASRDRQQAVQRAAEPLYLRPPDVTRAAAK